ncbi:MAG: DUF4097 family beta strand repeat-containing protein [Pseudomonadales bacterium]|nr:DUF4097 family beta strand repeat-containing protein [Pseudomonadales bacterium]
MQAAGDPIDESTPVRVNEKIFISVMRGTVRIVASPGQTLRVQGRLDERMESYRLASENGFTQFEIALPRSINTRRAASAGEGADLLIEVPPDSDIEFKGDSTAVSFRGITGGIKASTQSGSMQLEAIDGVVRLVTREGNIQSQNNSGRLIATTTTGTIVDNGSRGRMQLSTNEGRISLNSQAEQVALTTESGRIEGSLTGLQELDLDVGDGSAVLRIGETTAPRIHGSSYRGDIRLGLDAGVNARFSLFANVDAEIVNRFSDDQPRVDNVGGLQQLSFIRRRQLEQGIGVAPGTGSRSGPQRLNFIQGQGAGMVDLDTVSGSLTLEPAR